MRRRITVPAAAASSLNGKDRPIGELSAKSIVDAVKVWLPENGYPTWGADRLLQHPFIAASMAIEIDAAAGHRADERRGAAELAEWISNNEDLVRRIDRVCRVVMNARKAGMLSPLAPSPATRAARTRRRAVRS
jgi:hypothetical protein